MRVLLYTGKGGVGKSSLAAATAARAARIGRRVLVASADLAHNLGDIFGVPVGSTPTPVGPNLSALEVDPLAELRGEWRETQEFIAGLLAHLGVEQALAEETALLPGVDELLVLARILREIESGDYDLVASPETGPSFPA